MFVICNFRRNWDKPNWKPNPATYGSNDITDPNVFANVYNTLTDQLTQNGAKGVVANIPYVNTVPFFYYSTYKPIPATSIPVSSSAQLNQLFGAINQITNCFRTAKSFFYFSFR